MRQETELVIRETLEDFFRKYDLSPRCVADIIKAEVQNPCGWWNPSDDKEGADPDEHFRRYYGNLNETNVYLNWISHVHSHYGIYLPNYYKAA